MNNQDATPITSPCISQCCLDEEDICVGCFRHIDEITGWHGADNQRRQEILDNTAKRKLAKDASISNKMGGLS
ncbi:DUF1289 domain-containing protein [Aliikangiella coralliicola]|uniref:DUF1289 domain-containing protein n=1 Tax=Aliikangiella coralliicola TaxID=2592383 RepID=A0A545UGU6_9GAMM|nr:DUF1289 domain-containing protein [Aliikangiella coralliicola]TQV88633.1 DUF1289 domain-containing protein [Aliikangiella coralliicola]